MRLSRRHNTAESEELPVSADKLYLAGFAAVCGGKRPHPAFPGRVRFPAEDAELQQADQRLDSHQDDMSFSIFTSVPAVHLPGSVCTIMACFVYSEDLRNSLDSFADLRHGFSSSFFLFGSAAGYRVSTSGAVM